MLAELHTKSQITLPENIITSLGLREGDKLDIHERNGVIYMVPAIAYPETYITDLRNELSQLKKDIHSGKQPVFFSIDALIEKREAD